MSRAEWAGFDDVALSDLEDALSYAETCARDNYGAGYERGDPDDAALRRQHRRWGVLMRSAGRERERRERRGGLVFAPRPEPIPTDADAGVLVARVVFDVNGAEEDAALFEALAIHASGESDRARVFITERRPVLFVDEWDAVVRTAETVGRRKLEAGAP